MALLRVLCWALIFLLRLRFPPGSSIASILIYIINCNYVCEKAEKFCYKIFFQINQIKSKIPGISEYKFYQPKRIKR